MLGDVFFGPSLAVAGLREIDRLAAIANDLDAPFVLPPAGTSLVLVEPGPVGVYDVPFSQLAELQGLLRRGDPLPAASLAGSIGDDAALATIDGVGAIQNQLAATPEPYDIVALAPPPASYDAAVAPVFASRNAAPGQAVYDGAASGALLQAGADQLLGGEDFDAFYFYQYVVPVDVLAPGGGWGSVGRQKVVDGNGVLPRDRAFLRYDLVRRPHPGADAAALSRFTLGGERQGGDGLWSIEARLPLAGTVDHDASAEPGVGTARDVEWGNLLLVAKALLLADDAWAWSAGIGIGAPTADDVDVRWSDGTPLAVVENQAVYLKPFLAAAYVRGGWFGQGFLEVDADAAGNRVGLAPHAPLAVWGRFRDATYVFASGGVGYRWERSPRDAITAVVPQLEVHAAAADGGRNSLSAGPLTAWSAGAGNAASVTAGTSLELGPRCVASAGYVVAVDPADDRRGDAAFRMQLEIRPGR
jgi:hypothetical protein